MVDEFGGTEGIITLADIVEEIISDAVPLRRRRALHRAARGRAVARERQCAARRSHRALGFELMADGIDTIGGYVFNRLGYLPDVGATLEIPRLAITVRRVSRKRIEELLLEKPRAGAEEDPSAGVDSEA